jgi:DNA topoisomerase-1
MPKKEELSRKKIKTTPIAAAAATAPAPLTPYILVLVESPSKCATIEKYLGPGYRVLATYGHFRSLNSLKNIVFAKDGSTLELKFEVEKEKYVNLLQRAIANASQVILATDDDREGEAIAWHICDHFGLSVEETPRIIFHEITQEAITAAIQHPVRLNMNLVYAQFTRQVLDLLIGFKISPLLWAYISNNDKNSLSAGRCQTPALKMVLDNQMRINNTPTVIDYKVSGTFTSQNILFHLTTPISRKEEVEAFLEKSKNHSHILTVEEPTTATRHPPSPLNTSRLQQTVSNELHLSPKATMRICQNLYENGLITYMRTENTKYSQSFLQQTRKYLEKDGKGAAFTESPGRLVIPTSSKMAHEAIRPTNLQITHLSGAKYDQPTCKVYRLIWETSVASFMKPAVVSVRQAKITAPDGLCYSHSAELPVYAGWMSLAENNINKGYKNISTAYHFLENISQNTLASMSSITAQQECATTRNQLHYTESKLIRLLEEEGIGRPSTFASIVDKIQSRNYVAKENLEGMTVDCEDFMLDGVTKRISSTNVKKTFGAEKNKLVVKPMGIVVARFLYQHFADLFAFSYTKQTEELLDNIHQGTANWIEVCVTQKEYLSRLIKTAKENKIEKFHIPIDDTHCYMIAKYGPVIRQGRMSGGETPSKAGGGGVTGEDAEEEEKGEGEEDGTFATPTVKWLPVRKDIDLLRLENGEYTLADLLHTKAEPGTSAFLADHTPGGLPLYGGTFFGVFQDKEIIVRKGKFGRYAVWGEENRSLKCFGRRNLDNITMEEMTAVLEKPKRGLGCRPPSSGHFAERNQTTVNNSTTMAPESCPSGTPAPIATPSIEQIPTAPPKKRRSPPAPKAPSHNLPANLPPSAKDPTVLATEPPKKRGRPPKKSDEIFLEK